MYFLKQTNSTILSAKFLQNATFACVKMMMKSYLLVNVKVGHKIKINKNVLYSSNSSFFGIILTQLLILRVLKLFEKYYSAFYLLVLFINVE